MAISHFDLLTWPGKACPSGALDGAAKAGKRDDPVTEALDRATRAAAALQAALGDLRRGLHPEA